MSKIKTRYNKRLYSEKSSIEKDNPRKKVHRDPYDSPTFGTISSLSSPFLTPFSNLDMMDDDYSFKKRVFRYFQCSLAVEFPEIPLEEAIFYLTYLRKKFRNQRAQNKTLLPRKRAPTIKEKQILVATQHLLLNTYSYGDIARLVGLKRYDIINLASRLKKTKRSLPTKHRKKSKLQDDHINFLKDLLEDEDNAFLTLADIKKNLIEAYHDLKSISKDAIREAMIKNGLSFKKVAKYAEKLNSEKIKKSRNIVSRQLIYSLYHAYKIIFVDETSLHLHAKPAYGWGKKGKKIKVAHPPKTKNYSVITAITASKVLGCQIIKGGVKQHDFLGFICNLVRHYEIHETTRKIVIFLDNASVHHSKFVQESLKSKVTFLFNAGYSPMLNPIEEFFSKFKKMVKKSPLSNDKQLIRAVQKALSTFIKEDLYGYVRHTLSFAEDSLYNISVV